MALRLAGLAHRRLAHRPCERDRTHANFGVNGRALLSDYAELNEPTIPSEEGFGLEQPVSPSPENIRGVSGSKATVPRPGAALRSLN
jgi:hypothetical protein